MDAGERSLIDRAMARVPSVRRDASRRWRLAAIDGRFALAIAALIALGPLATIVAAGVVERSVRAETRALGAAAAPRLRAGQADRAARARLRRAVTAPPVAIWLDRAARALPGDARVSRVARLPDGTIELDVTAPDPDSLRAAIRRDPAMAGFREVAQRRAGAMILVRWRAQAR